MILNQSLKLDGTASATHNIYAYRFRGIINENIGSEGNFADAVDIVLLKALCDDKILNMICIITRLCVPDYNHMAQKLTLNRLYTHSKTSIPNCSVDLIVGFHCVLLHTCN